MRYLLSSILILLLIFSYQTVKSQNNDLVKDLKFVAKSIKIDKQEIRPYIYKDEKNVLIKYNPISLFFGGMLFMYQNTITYQFSADCLYNPSCSEYSKQSIRQYGFVKGCFLSADRITRCNRISATGIHYLKINKHNHKCNDIVELYSMKRYK